MLRPKYTEHISFSDRFYDTAFKKKAAHRGFELHLGQGVDALEPEPDRINIKVGDRMLSARQVYDGRLVGSDLNSWRCLLQHYGGQIVETNRSVFNPDIITLMDFDIPRKEGIAIVYVLPLSPQLALIEPTFFSYRPLSMDHYRFIIQSYLLERYHVTQYTVEFEEQGIIPMKPQAPPAPAAERIQPIGTQAGMVKGSTGYGFLSIQKSTPMLVQQALEADQSKMQVPWSNFSIWLDTVFLRYIEQHPGHAPEIFFNLFDRVNPDALVRFLSDVAAVFPGGTLWLTNALGMMAPFATLAVVGSAIWYYYRFVIGRERADLVRAGELVSILFVFYLYRRCWPSPSTSRFCILFGTCLTLQKVFGLNRPQKPLSKLRKPVGDVGCLAPWQG